MLIIRLFWRLDYQPSYTYLDKRGSALRLLTETVDGFWHNVGVGAQIPNSFAANFADARVLRFFSLELTSMNGSIEWSSGIDPERVLTDDAFRGMDKIVRELLRLCEIRTMTRAGVRVICLAKFRGGHSGEGFKRTLAMAGGEVTSKLERGLGEIADFGTIFEGKSTDEVLYRATFGPYARKNVEALLQRKLEPDQYRFFDENELFFDIDLFENNISFTEHSLYRWAGTKIAKAAEFINIISDN
jgi:hypothetical protein